MPESRVQILVVSSLRHNSCISWLSIRKSSSLDYLLISVTNMFGKKTMLKYDLNVKHILSHKISIPVQFLSFSNKIFLIIKGDNFSKTFT